MSLLTTEEQGLDPWLAFLGGLAFLFKPRIAISKPQFHIFMVNYLVAIIIYIINEENNNFGSCWFYKIWFQDKNITYKNENQYTIRWEPILL